MPLKAARLLAKLQLLTVAINTMPIATTSKKDGPPVILRAVVDGAESPPRRQAATSQETRAGWRASPETKPAPTRHQILGPKARKSET